MRSCRQMSQVPWLLFCLSSFQKSLFTLPHIPAPDFHKYLSLTIFPNAIHMGRGNLSTELCWRVAWGAAYSITSEKLHNSQEKLVYFLFLLRKVQLKPPTSMYCILLFYGMPWKNSRRSHRNSCFLFSQQRHFSICFLPIALVSY